MAEEIFDAVVVGAGPAGVAAALTMARAGLDVVVLERGEYPGSKNLQGGVLYRHPTEELVPQFWEKAPVERPVVRQSIWLLDEEGAVQVGYGTRQWAQPPYNAFTVLRARFDPWFAQQAEEAGAMIITSATVTGLIKEKDQVVGVRTSLEDGDVYGRVVIIAQGVNALLVQEAGLGPDLRMDQAALGVKEVLALPSEKIEDRFGLEKGEGATIELVGFATQGMAGNVFIYTNKDTISFGGGAILSQLVARQVNVSDLLDAVRMHPAVKPLLEGAERVEYTAKLMPERGYRHLPRLVGNGVLVAGDAAGFLNPINREGSNMAMISGKLAGEAVIRAKEKGDFSARGLAWYREALAQSFILKDLKKIQDAVPFLEGNAHFLQAYPHLLSGLMREYFTVDGRPKEEKRAKFWNLIRGTVPPLTLVRDALRAWKVMGP